MTIHSQIRRAGPYTSSIGSSRLPFSFKVFKESDLLVLRIDTAGKAATLSLSSDYTVELNDNQDVNPGGVVVLASVIPTGQKVLISSNIPYLQLTDLQNQGGFHPKVIVSALDKLTILIQQIIEQLSWSGKIIVIPPHDSDSAGTWIQRGIGAVRRAVQAKLRETVSVTDFMTVSQIADAGTGNPTGDHTKAIQAAINSGAKRIVSPAGLHYRITAPLTINKDYTVLDFSLGGLLLDDPSGTLSHIIVGYKNEQIHNVRIQNVIFGRVQAATEGAAIDTKNVGLLKVSGCRIYGNNKIYRGVSILSGTMCEISDCYIDNCIGPSIFLMGYPGLEGRTVDIVIRHNRIDGGQGLTSWNYVEGIFCRDNIFCNATPSVNINAEPGKGLVSFKLQDNDFDTSKDIGVYIDNVANIQITGCWFSNLESGLVIGEAAHSLIVSSNQMYCRGGHGITVKGDAVRINDNLISGADSCIYVGAPAQHISICGNSLGNANYGINLGENPRNSHVVGNYIFGMRNGSIIDSHGVGVMLIGNNTDVAHGRTRYITVGSSPFTYTAGSAYEYISIYNGNVTGVEIDGTNFGGGLQSGVFLAPRQSVTVHFSAPPYMVCNTL